MHHCLVGGQEPWLAIETVGVSGGERNGPPARYRCNGQPTLLCRRRRHDPRRGNCVTEDGRGHECARSSHRGSGRSCWTARRQRGATGRSVAHRAVLQRALHPTALVAPNASPVHPVGELHALPPLADGVAIAARAIGTVTTSAWSAGRSCGSLLVGADERGRPGRVVRRAVD